MDYAIFFNYSTCFKLIAIMDYAIFFNYSNIKLNTINVEILLCSG